VTAQERLPIERIPNSIGGGSEVVVWLHGEVAGGMGGVGGGDGGVLGSINL